MSKFVNWLLNTSAFSIPRRLMIRFVHYIFAIRKIKLVSINYPGTIEALSLIQTIKKETDLAISDTEAFQIYRTVQILKKISGDVAEVGVYKGGSAKIICEANQNVKVVHLFDTFEGLPEVSAKDNTTHFHKGDYLASYEEVKNYLSKYQNVHLYKGLFPNTAGPIEGKRFSFVNLDVDLYEPTLSSLRFFYERMNKGGVIISHDYLTSVGVRKAFDEFFEDKTEVVMEILGSSQAFVVKT